MHSNGEDSHEFYSNDIDDVKNPYAPASKKFDTIKRSDTKEAKEIRDLSQGLTLTDLEEARAIHKADTKARTPVRSQDSIAN